VQVSRGKRSHCHLTCTQLRTRIPWKKSDVIALGEGSPGGRLQSSIAMGRIVHEAQIRTFMTAHPPSAAASAPSSFSRAAIARLESPPRQGSANVMAACAKHDLQARTYFQRIDADLDLLGFGLKQKDMHYLKNDEALRHGSTCSTPRPTSSCAPCGLQVRRRPTGVASSSCPPVVRLHAAGPDAEIDQIGAAMKTMYRCRPAPRRRHGRDEL